MKVRFHGVRGSIPSPGPSTVRYGGNTVCVEVRLVDGTLLLLDGGTGLRECGMQLLREGFAGPMHLLISHLHWDHVIGVPFFAPMWRRETTLRVFPAPTDAQQAALLRRAIFDGVHFPVGAEAVPASIEFLSEGERTWQIGSARVTRVPLNHPGGAQGFRIDDADGRSLAYLTDNELFPPGKIETSLDDLARFASGVDVLIHDAQYVQDDLPLKHGWGHSTVDQVLRLGLQAEATHLVPFHHEPTRDDDALDALGERLSGEIARQGRSMRCTLAREGWQLDV